MTRISAPPAVLAALIALGALAPAVTQADEGPRGAAFETLDTDGNGSLSQAELSARAEARFAEADTDGDGLLTAEEMQAAREARRAARESRMIERLDSNGDGALSFAELTDRRDPARLFERLDTDGDGALSPEEFAEAKTHMGRHGPRDGHRRN
ncbi:EF-hand domain-containing protein [Roseivivax sp.]